MFRYWKVHFSADPPEHWVTVDCGKPVSESEAVELTKAAVASSGSRGEITAAVPDFERHV